MYNSVSGTFDIVEGTTMTLTTIEQEILSQLHTLALPQQREVLALVRILSAAPVGVPGNDLLAFAGIIDLRDLAALKQAIDTDCEQVNLNEW
jgi:hypothetical protein